MTTNTATAELADAIGQGLPMPVLMDGTPDDVRAYCHDEGAMLMDEDPDDFTGADLAAAVTIACQKVMADRAAHWAEDGE